MSFQVQGEVGALQASAMPRLYALRVCVESPQAGDIVDALRRLSEAGAPSEAEIVFQRWNTPDSRWYVIAQWPEVWSAERWAEEMEGGVGS